jgi:hypothetical protein
MSLRALFLSFVSCQKPVDLGANLNGRGPPDRHCAGDKRESAFDRFTLSRMHPQQAPKGNPKLEGFSSALRSRSRCRERVVQASENQKTRTAGNGSQLHLINPGLTNSAAPLFIAHAS